MSILSAEPPATRTCGCCGQPSQILEGQIEVAGAEPLYAVMLHGGADDPRAWTAFVTGPWQPDDGSRGAWVSLQSHVEGDDVICSITDPEESPWAKDPRFANLRGLERATLYGVEDAPEYFYQAHEELLTHEPRILAFLRGGVV